ncbi:hypothetical protein G6F37_004802 [Rhizopus arrhizus]|nr:hypothetical protein G6F38_006163 [Rhizopus arrhizus]KAG1159542.1 hypothetical protein G6F37_004802 [Rhizopus arrhizus]
MATPASVEALHLVALGASFSILGLTAMFTSLLRAPRLANATTNRPYKRGQTLFIEYALTQDILLTSFTDVHLINFLTKYFKSVAIITQPFTYSARQLLTCMDIRPFYVQAPWLTRSSPVLGPGLLLNQFIAPLLTWALRLEQCA